MNAMKKSVKNPIKRIETYEIGNYKLEVNFSDKHSIRLAYINITLYWLCKVLIIILMMIAANSVNNILKALER